MMITGDYINGQPVTLECNAGYVIDVATECTCDTTGANPTWNCDPDNMISCVASKQCVSDLWPSDYEHLKGNTRCHFCI